MAWAETIVAALREQGVSTLAVVPDETLIPLLALVRDDAAFRTVYATREEEAVGIVAGVSLGGGRGAVLMQGSGLGNCLNALASLAVPYQLPIPLLIGERGTLGEHNPVQVPMGRLLRPALDALGIQHATLARADEVTEVAGRTLGQAFRTQAPAALILSPLLTGGKVEGRPRVAEGGDDGEVAPGRAATRGGTGPLRPLVASGEGWRSERGPILNRLALTRRLVDLAGEGAAIVAGIGNTNFDLAAAAGDRGANFPMLGSMGLTSSIGLGVALAQPGRRVVALEGDGSLLMNLGTLATIASAAPPNLALVIWDNGAYQITGGQPTATAGPADLVAIARGAGIARSRWATDEADFVAAAGAALRGDGPHLIAARVDRAPGAGRPARDPVVLKDRFMRAIGAKGRGEG